MRTAWILSASIWFVIAGTAAAQMASATAEPVYTRQRSFAIPFQVQQPAGASDAPAEVQLYVSSDQGSTWQMYARVPPTDNRFGFAAQADGEYWFLVRTVDRGGRIHPDVPPLPELRVVIDTALPQLALDASRGPAGELHARYRINDLAIDPSNLRIEYQLEGETDAWQDVAAPAPTPAQAGSHEGEVSWWPELTTRVATIRATVTDQAGNTAVTQTQVPAGTGPSPEQVQAPAGGRPVAQRASQAWPAERSDAGPLGSQVTSNPDPGSWGAEVLQTPPPRTGIDDDGPASSNSAASLNQRPPDERSLAADRDRDGRVVRPSRGGAAEVLPAPDPTSRARMPDAADATADWGRTRSRRPGARQPAEFSSGAAGFSGYEDDERLQMVGTRTFELEYDVESVGISGISRVELWGTRNGGRTWESFGLDDDNRSPVVATVDGEGVYGFRVVVHSGAGLRGEDPAPGDAPEILVGVDLTPPEVGFLDVQQSPQRVGEIVIRWDARDRKLAAMPISLYYAAVPQGPWLLIAAGVENTGEYRWLVDANAPDSIYLRVEARDEAGNVQADGTLKPLSLDRMRPKGHIRGVRPREQSRRSTRVMMQG